MIIGCRLRIKRRVPIVLTILALLTQVKSAVGQERGQTLADVLSNVQIQESIVRVSTTAAVLTGRIQLGEVLSVGNETLDTAEILLIERRLSTRRPASFALRGAILGATVGALSIIANNFNEIGCSASCLVYRVGGGGMIGSMAGYGIGLSRSGNDWEIAWRRN